MLVAETVWEVRVDEVPGLSAGGADFSVVDCAEPDTVVSGEADLVVTCRGVLIAETCTSEDLLLLLVRRDSGAGESRIFCSG